MAAAAEQVVRGRQSEKIEFAVKDPCNCGCNPFYDKHRRYPSPGEAYCMECNNLFGDCVVAGFCSRNGPPPGHTGPTTRTVVVTGTTAKNMEKAAKAKAKATAAVEKIAKAKAEENATKAQKAASSKKSSK